LRAEWCFKGDGEDGSKEFSTIGEHVEEGLDGLISIEIPDGVVDVGAPDIGEQPRCKWSFHRASIVKVWENSKR
jgi:hypothetical protein